MTKRTRNEHPMPKQNQNANTKDPGRIYMAAFHLFCTQNLRPGRQLARVLVLLVGNKYDAVIFLMSGTTRTFYGGHDEKRENKYVVTSVMEIRGQ